MPLKHKNTLQHHRKHHRPRGVTQKAYEKTYWPFLPFVVLIAFVLALSPLGDRHTTARPLTPRIPGRVLAYATSMSVSGLLQQTNSHRGANGVPSLGLNGQLNAAAQNKANDMASRNYWSHNTPEGSPPWIFVDAQGYDYKKIGENLAAGFADEASTINGWMNSAGHRANMLDTAFTEVGFGFANNANYTSAGGGPMTIVVAFYGQPVGASQPAPPPTCPAGQVGTPPNCSVPAATTQSASSPPSSAQSNPSSSPPAETATPAEAAVPSPEQAAPTPQSAPVTSANKSGTDPPARNTSQLQTIITNPRMATFTTSALTVGMVVFGLMWASRHVLRLRRAMVKSEEFAVHHPSIDILLLSLIAIALALTQTAGVIK